MERIISYDELPYGDGQSVYLRKETDPRLLVSLIAKRYRVVDHVLGTDESTIYLTGARQVYGCKTPEEYRYRLDNSIQDSLARCGITKPKTTKLSIKALREHKYKLPFVLKNETFNGGKEKFLIKTEEDYENLLSACDFLLNRNLFFLTPFKADDLERLINYDLYLNRNFSVQEYIPTPSKYNTTVRLLTTPSYEILYGALKYKKPTELKDNTSMLGYLLTKVYPLSTPSIVSNTVRGGSNILLGENKYPNIERLLLESHDINSESFQKLIRATKEVHKEYKDQLGILCGFDYIYDCEREQWFLLEYHDKPMVGDYSKRQGIRYGTKKERLEADGRVRATALSLSLKKTR